MSRPFDSLHPSYSDYDSYRGPPSTGIRIPGPATAAGILPNINDVVTPLVLSCLHALRLCFLLTLFVRPDRFNQLPDSLRTLPLSRYLAALVSTRLTMLTFLFRLCFSRSRCLCLLPLFS